MRLGELYPQPLPLLRKLPVSAFELLLFALSSTGKILEGKFIDFYRLIFIIIKGSAVQDKGHSCFSGQESARMGKEDKMRLSFLVIVTVIVMMFNIHSMSASDRKGLKALDSIFNGYLTQTAMKWAQAQPQPVGQ